MLASLLMALDDGPQRSFIVLSARAFWSRVFSGREHYFQDKRELLVL